MIKEVTDVYGRKVKIETDGQKVYSYNNKEHRVQYNAKWVDSASGFSWTDYIEDGTVEDLETRISVFGSRLDLIYASTVGYNSTDNDPDKKSGTNLLITSEETNLSSSMNLEIKEKIS